ncbi:MAG: stage II sporulation protein M [Nitrososphaerota archaeon]|nr:stage II sporulation protein M [Aigarchaeota archaeon]MDW8076795.1 stage II sporulation protein M [Nitrososphaerota archaeon]
MTLGSIPIRRRLLFVIVTTLALVIVLLSGSSVTLSQEESEEIIKQVSELFRDIDVWKIFLNNFQIALLMFIPAVGTFIGGYIVYSTGIVFAAYSVQSSIPSIYLAGLAVLSPYGVLEFLGYGLATSEGLLIIYAAFKKRLRSEVKKLPLIILAVAGLLLTAAALEMLMIEAILKY